MKDFNIFKLFSFVAITFGCLGLWNGINATIQISFESLDDFEQTTAELKRVMLVDSTTIDQSFKYKDSDYLGFKFKSDSSTYALYHLNLDLKKIQNSLEIGEKLTIYYQNNKNRKNVKQLERNGVVIASFEDNKDYLSKTYRNGIFIGAFFLLIGLLVMKRKTRHNKK